jgi:hypothetical protein
MIVLNCYRFPSNVTIIFSSQVMTDVIPMNSMKMFPPQRLSEEGTRRPLDFNETQPMELGTAVDDITEVFPFNGAKVFASPTRGQADAHSSNADANAPHTTRKRPPPMSLDRYSQLRSMLMNRRQQRIQAHDAIVRDTEQCNATSEDIEGAALPQALSTWADSYDTLQATLERSPAVKSCLASSWCDSPVGLSGKSSVSLQNGSPSAAAKSLKPVLEAIDRIEARRVEFSNVQALERKLQLAQDQAALRLQSFHDERMIMEHQLQSAQTETRQQRRRKEQIQTDLEEMTDEAAMTEELNTASAALTRLQFTAESHRNAAAFAERSRADSVATIAGIADKCTELLQQIHAVMRDTLLNEDEPQCRRGVEMEAASSRQELLSEIMRTTVSLSRKKADQSFERLSTQLSELQRLSSGEASLAPAAERLAELKKEREHAAAEIRELNHSMHELDEAIADLSSSLPSGSAETEVTEGDVRVAIANVRALELILERRREQLDTAAASEGERREINDWLRETNAPIPAIFNEVVGADHLVRYRTLQRQCVLLASELSSVHTQQREQQEFTSLGLYHSLEEDVAEAKAKVASLDQDEASLTADVAEALRKEDLTDRAREAVVQEESIANAEIDALRDEELQLLAETASMQTRLQALQADEAALQEEERVHQAERHRRYLMSLGVLGHSNVGAPANDQQVPAAAASPQLPRRPIRSRQEVLAGGATVITVNPSTPHAAVPQRPLSNSDSRWWWPWSSRRKSVAGNANNI